MELLSVAEMYEADRLAIAGGTSSLELMENAGAGVAHEILARFGARPTTILCGPGNNGGDGFVIARHLRREGAAVRLTLLGRRSALKGDAAAMAKRWDGGVEALNPTALDGAELIVDAIFGAGLTRPVEGAVAEMLTAAHRRGLPSVAVDVPSGIDGDSGQVLGTTLPAAMTVTFFRPKTGHRLYPGRALCGELRVIDIGIPASVLNDMSPQAYDNTPERWRHLLPWPAPAGHKYDRGHAVVLSGPRTRSGAARLGARTALRVGAGLVSVASPTSAVAENAAQLTAIMLREWRDRVGFARTIADRRLNAVLLGPGAGVGALTRDNVLAALRVKKSVVLDADALTSFARNPGRLFKAIGSPCIMTPHEGEFARLFDTGGSKLERARRAAQSAGAIILLKGADTVAAAPDGRVVINGNAPPELATAGSGDVLAGLCLGLLAQGMPAFEAAAAAAWMHGEAGRVVGPGLIAEDLPEALPAVLQHLKSC